jgi:hypothetical protein
VRPGGIGLEVRAGTRPLILRVTPEPVRPGGRVRIDAALAGTFEGLAAGGIEVPAGDASVVVAPEGSPVVLTLDDGGLEGLGEGAHPLIVRASAMASRRGVLRVAAGEAPAIDALPAPTHDPSTNLVVTGANLAAAEEAILWPDVGVTAPTDVHGMAVDNVTAGSVTVPSAGGLADLPAARGPWRLTLRIGEHRYTPYVLVELEP